MPGFAQQEARAQQCMTWHNPASHRACVQLQVMGVGTRTAGSKAQWGPRGVGEVITWYGRIVQTRQHRTNNQMDGISFSQWPARGEPLMLDVPNLNSCLTMTPPNKRWSRQHRVQQPYARRFVCHGITRAAGCCCVWQVWRLPGCLPVRVRC